MSGSVSSPGSKGRLLVTGGRGLLGNAVVRAALADGWDVVCFQRHPSGMADEQSTGGARVADFLGSIVEAADVRRALEGVDAVVHLAARVGIDGSWPQFETVNVEGTRLVLECAADAGVHAFVYVSSPSVAHVGEPLIAAAADTADPARTRGHYSRSKAMAERIALDPRVSMPVVAVRPHLVWGPGDQQLVGRIIDRAASGRLFLIDGGRALIDTTYVDNAGEAIVRALDRAQDPSVRGRAFVVSNGEPRPVRDVIEAIVDAAGVEVSVRSIPRGPAWVAGTVGEAAASVSGREPVITRFLVEQLSTAHWFDPRQTWEALQWRPRVSFDEGIARLAASLRRA